MSLLSENKKMRQSSVRTFNWTLPAYQSRTGLKTCPLAGTCAKGCYAQQGAYTWKNVYTKHEANLQLTKNTKEFVVAMVSEIEMKLRSAKRGNYQIAIRIHDSGDFYSLQYLISWITIMTQLPDVQFYAYTKMLPLFEREDVQRLLPGNFTVIYSEGGKADHLIDTSRHRHSRVFATLDELREAGYVDATEDDTRAWKSVNHRIGLVYHGAKSRKWTTAA